jgi:hypothetical protein
MKSSVRFARIGFLLVLCLGLGVSLRFWKVSADCNIYFAQACANDCPAGWAAADNECHTGNHGTVDTSTLDCEPFCSWPGYVEGQCTDGYQIFENCH